MKKDGHIIVIGQLVEATPSNLQAPPFMSILFPMKTPDSDSQPLMDIFLLNNLQAPSMLPHLASM
jgi:hypothetical protein